MNYRFMSRSPFRLFKMYSHLATATKLISPAWKEIKIPVPWGHIAGRYIYIPDDLKHVNMFIK